MIRFLVPAWHILAIADGTPMVRNSRHGRVAVGAGGAANTEALLEEIPPLQKGAGETRHNSLETQLAASESEGSQCTFNNTAAHCVAKLHWRRNPDDEFVFTLTVDRCVSGLQLYGLDVNNLTKSADRDEDAVSTEYASVAGGKEFSMIHASGVNHCWPANKPLVEYTAGARNETPASVLHRLRFDFINGVPMTMVFHQGDAYHLPQYHRD
eukprot:TRINITY_DN89033_c0_g1_i1.p1 TRINITY_DN89033_c0_g1~~TRINITY_DN89033_c0_g1_i1.p1  ORF type:complete len:211 (+),score=23.44 TRINITY_DN89033_c0_g1_i1:210-842(+)